MKACIGPIDKQNWLWSFKHSLYYFAPAYHFGWYEPSSLTYEFHGREPWFSGYGWRFMFERSWVWIPVPYTGWPNGHFFTLICYKNCIVCLKRPKINEKEAGVGPFNKRVPWSIAKLARVCSNSIVKLYTGGNRYFPILFVADKFY